MSDPAPKNLLALAEDLARQAGRFHPGRPPFSALSRASDALKLAAQEVALHERLHGRLPAE